MRVSNGKYFLSIPFDCRAASRQIELFVSADEVIE